MITGTVNLASHLEYQWTSYDYEEDKTSTSVITFDDGGDYFEFESEELAM
jgi:hypothetical protein